MCREQDKVTERYMSSYRPDLDLKPTLCSVHTCASQVNTWRTFQPYKLSLLARGCILFLARAYSMQ